MCGREGGGGSEVGIRREGREGGEGRRERGMEGGESVIEGGEGWRESATRRRREEDWEGRGGGGGRMRWKDGGKENTLYKYSLMYTH